ncbi:MAG TPA: choice-of-anchor D domain-containing protein [Spirochaetia bacterium]|nr:choice-of-anchor D domain-containing protein [Spirochaetia bacterium]
MASKRSGKNLAAIAWLILVGAAPAAVVAQSAAPGSSSGYASSAQSAAPSAPTQPGSPATPPPAAKNLPKTQIEAGDTVVKAGASITFPDTPIATASAPIVFTITNSGDAPLELDQFDPPELDGEGSLFYLLDFTSLAMSVDPGGSTSLGVSFFPADLGSAEATLVITSNDPRTPVLTINLSAKGIENPAFQGF